MERRLQLPACQKCKLRKIRCDRGAPKCTNCTRGNVACLIVDPETGEQYARDYIRQLEEEEHNLREKLADSDQSDRGTPVYSTHVALSPDSAERPQDRRPWSTGNTDSQSHYVGDGSGLGFLQSILSDAKWQQHRVRIMNQLAARPRLQRQQPTPNPLPSLQEAELLLENYFTRFHIHHTFLLRSEVFGIFNRLYSPAPTDRVITAQDRYRLLMVFAVSATTKHRSGLTCQDPYGYFKAAEAYLGNIDLIGNVDAIQNLLLITRFGMYHHIGTSLWDISQLCMRQCIEWRLHLRRSVLLDPLTEQHYRRIFWACYVLDRHNSGILGRPFGILDTDIDVQLPADVDDETIVNSGVDSLDMIAPRTDSRPTELSVFIHCIKLRQISSRIHTDFYTGRSPSSHQSEYAGNTSSSKFKSIGHVYTSFSRFYSELKAWWSTNPTFSNPRSLYEKPEWHAFLYEKDLMLLARGALYNIPSRSYSFGGPVKEIFLTCYQAASRVIELYGDLMQKGAITWTRTYFQVIFTAGLSVIYCISQGVVKDMMNGREPVKTLTLCREILALFREKMPDAGSFTFVFEVLESECIRSKINVEEEAQYTESATTYNIINQGTGAEDGTSSLTDMAPQQDSTDVGNSHLNAYHMQPFDQESNDMTLNFTGNLDLMTQLQTGMDEYAWGWIPMDGNFWDQTTFY